LAPYEKSKFLGSRGVWSQGIDGRALKGIYGRALNRKVEALLNFSPTFPMMKLFVKTFVHAKMKHFVH